MHLGLSRLSVYIGAASRLQSGAAFEPCQLSLVRGGSTGFLMNDLSELLRMPMKTIEAIVLVSRLKTFLRNCQRSVIVLCKNDNVEPPDLPGASYKPIEA